VFSASVGLVWANIAWNIIFFANKKHFFPGFYSFLVEKKLKKRKSHPPQPASLLQTGRGAFLCAPLAQ
jgi:hypothetical protein